MKFRKFSRKPAKKGRGIFNCNIHKTREETSVHARIKCTYSKKEERERERKHFTFLFIRRKEKRASKAQFRVARKLLIVSITSKIDKNENIMQKCE